MRRIFQIALALGAVAALGIAVAAGVFYAVVLRDLPEIYSLKDYRPNLITRIRAVDGTEIATLAEERRIVVPIEKIPDHVVRAFIAAEDDQFYEHEGLDYPGILRAAFANVRSGRVTRGGSTITQQVAKTFLLSSERKLSRKLKDMVLAMRIEEYLEKNEILYLYLNQIYFGSGAHGIEAAAQTYFDKSVSELTLGEGAMIAGLVPAPSRFTPFRSFDRAQHRQRLVLGRMIDIGFISQEEHDAALAEEIVLAERGGSEDRDAVAYFVEEVRRHLVTRYGEQEVLTGGLDVVTTLSLDAQRTAYRELRKGLRAHDRRAGYRGPLLHAPEDEWLRVAEDLESRFGSRELEKGQRRNGLVVAIDDRGKFATVALGLGREIRLPFDEMKWARKPDPSWDGYVPRIRRVSQALAPGYLIVLEHKGMREPTDAEREADPEAAPVPEYTLYQEPETEGAILSMDVATGAIRAMVGGYDFGRSQFNRAVQMKRQPGSAFKPFIYAAAMSRGFTPATIVFDTPIVYEDRITGITWKPGNYSDKFYGPITLREALARSRNIATIKVLRDVGIPPVLEMAQALGVRSTLEPNLSLALGTSEVTLAELVRAYSVFASGGTRLTPRFIVEVRDREGNLLEESTPLPMGEEPAADVASQADAEGDPTDDESFSQRLIDEIRAGVDRADDPDALAPGKGLDPVASYLMVDLLKAVIKEGSGHRVRWVKRPLAGKTGTTQDQQDAWFLGFSPQLVTGVWVGYDEARNLGKNETGGRAAAPIFASYMNTVLKPLPAIDFPIPAGIEFSRIDKKTGLRAAPDDEKAVFQPFRVGTAPLEFARAGGTNGRAAPPLRLD